VAEGAGVPLSQLHYHFAARGLQLGPFTAEHVATLLALTFLGGESLLLLAIDDGMAPVRESLRRVGELMRHMETRGTS
jgi:hypothetical protein